MEQQVSLFMAFAAGLISFLSPCVLPLIPGYISFVSGVSLEDMTDTAQGNRLKAALLVKSLLFVLGFSAVFVLMGASATWLGSIISTKLSLLTKLAGVVIILFGLHLAGLLRFGFLLRGLHLRLPAKSLGPLSPVLLGASFGFGWTPCVGPVLAAILTFAATLETVRQGIQLLISYSAGLGIPFLLTSLAVNGFFRLFGRIKNYLWLVEKVSGTVLVLLGVLMVTGKVTLIVSKLTFLNLFAW
ncbi:MAG: cytochrome c biogenesis protein CcdA [Deltaproteobacteria bacterium]|nr:MAG: cytochrome c biogenesis protein CcdA [Deltaproteobacteria bacterium]